MRNLQRLLRRLMKMRRQAYPRWLWRSDELLRHYGSSLHEVSEDLSAAEPELIRWLARAGIIAVGEEWELFIDECAHRTAALLAVPASDLIEYNGRLVNLNISPLQVLVDLSEDLVLPEDTRFRVEIGRRRRTVPRTDDEESVPHRHGFLFHILRSPRHLSEDRR